MITKENIILIKKKLIILILKIELKCNKKIYILKIIIIKKLSFN